MKYLFLLMMMIGSSAFAEVSNKIESCVIASQIDEVYFCDFGIIQAIHFKGQPVTFVQKPAPQPTASPAPEVKAKKK